MLAPGILQGRHTCSFPCTEEAATVQTYLYMVEVDPCIPLRSSTTIHSLRASLTLAASGLRYCGTTSCSARCAHRCMICNHESQHVHCIIQGQLFSVQQLCSNIRALAV